MRTIVLFTTAVKPITLHFAVGPTRIVVKFSTSAKTTTIHFGVAALHIKVLFYTGVKPVTIHFKVAKASTDVLLDATLNDNGTCLKVILSSNAPTDAYALYYSGLPSDGTAIKKANSALLSGLTAWDIPIDKDGVISLELKGKNLFSTAMVLINHRTLRQLSRHAKKASVCDKRFQQLSYYNAMVIALYQASDFDGCVAMLQLLNDLSSCTLA